MSKAKKGNVGKNIAYMTVYHVITAIAPLIVTPYLSRVLGKAEIGKYTYAYSIAYYFVLVANLGITTHGSRRIAEVKDDSDEFRQTFSDIFWLHTFNALIVFVIYIASVFAGMNAENSKLSFIMAFYVLSSVVDCKWLFYGLENFKVTVIRSIIVKVIYVIAIFLFVKTRNDVGIYTFIMAFGAFFLAEVSLFVMLPRYAKLSKPCFASIKKEVKPLIILFIPSVANLVLRHFDKIMIGQLSTYDELGMYENTDRIFMILVTLITAVGDVLLPRISNLRAGEDSKKADKLFHQTLRMSIIVSCAFSFGIMSVCKEFVPLFFGKEFGGCVALLTWIAPSIVMLTISASIRKQYLIPRYLERVYLTATISSLIVNIIANWILIPKYDALGAVYGTLIAEMTVLVIQYIMIHKDLNYVPYFKDVVIYSIVGIIMFLVVRMIANINAGDLVLVILEIIGGAVVYVGITIFVMRVTKDELLEVVKVKVSKGFTKFGK